MSVTGLAFGFQGQPGAPGQRSLLSLSFCYKCCRHAGILNIQDYFPNSMNERVENPKVRKKQAILRHDLILRLRLCCIFHCHLPFYSLNNWWKKPQLKWFFSVSSKNQDISDPYTSSVHILTDCSAFILTLIVYGWGCDKVSKV